MHLGTSKLTLLLILNYEKLILELRIEGYVFSAAKVDCAM